jgi:hypothetical protein
MSWLRYETDDGQGTANPLANYIQRVYTEISSQPGRMFNDFRHLGFNEDDHGSMGRKVFDGHMQWISAGSGIGMNYRFSQSGRTERNRQDHLYPENLWPFANVPTTDPLHGKDGQPLRKVPGNRDAHSAWRSTRPTSTGEDRFAPAHDTGRLQPTFRNQRSRGTTSCPACAMAPATRRTGGVSAVR